MKHRLIGWSLSYLGKKLDGKKTYGGAAGKIMLGLSTILGACVSTLGLIFPDLGLPTMDVEKTMTAFGAGGYAVTSGLQGFGIGHKIEKASERST